jgi:Cyclin, N-terminal domain
MIAHNNPSLCCCATPRTNDVYETNKTNMAIDSSSSSFSSTTSDADESLGFSRDQIQALLRREDQYLCLDYTASSFQQQQQQERDDDRDMMDSSATCISIIHKVPSTCSLRDVQAERQSSAAKTTASAGSSTAAVTALHQQQQEFGAWRHQMFDWAVMVVDSIGADRESVACCFHLLDRFLVTELRRTRAPPITRDDYQLFCMTCLYIATKVIDPYPHKLSVQTLVDMSNNTTRSTLLNKRNWTF